MTKEDKTFIKGLIAGLSGEFAGLSGEFADLRSDLGSKIDKNSQDINKLFKAVDKNSEDIKNNSDEIHQIHLLIEHQNDFLGSVAEGITSLGTRVTRLETQAI